MNRITRLIYSLNTEIYSLLIIGKVHSPVYYATTVMKNTGIKDRETYKQLLELFTFLVDQKK